MCYITFFRHIRARTATLYQTRRELLANEYLLPRKGCQLSINMRTVIRGSIQLLTTFHSTIIQQSPSDTTYAIQFIHPASRLNENFSTARQQRYQAESHGSLLDHCADKKRAEQQGSTLLEYRIYLYFVNTEINAACHNSSRY